MKLLSVNTELCKKDYLCQMSCPLYLIAPEKDGFPGLVDGAADRCIVCGHCVSVCPTGAMTHRDMSPCDCLVQEKKDRLDKEQAEKFLRARRSIRAYKDKPVDKALLKELVRVSSHAPTGHNSQDVEWIVYSDREKIRKLAEITVEWMRFMIKNMPEAAAELNMDMVVLAWEAGLDVVLRDAPALVITHADSSSFFGAATCGTALAWAELYAPALGLGSCWAGFFTVAANTYEPMKKALSIPEGRTCSGALMVGFPRLRYRLSPSRKEKNIEWR